MGKTAIWEILCFYPLPPLNNVENQRAKFASSYVMGSQHCIGGEGTAVRGTNSELYTKIWVGETEGTTDIS